MDAFVAAVTLVFGMLAWLQLPAVCGFMLSSTRAGAGNYLYSLCLGVFVAGIGIAAGFDSIVRRRRHALLVIGFVANAAFILCAIFAHRWYGEECRAIYTFFAAD